MRKIKKINGYLIVKFNDREKREYEGTALGEYGVIDAELYTGNLDIDRGAMEYDDADSLEVAVELARGLESEEDITDEPPTYTIVTETDDTFTEEEVNPQLMIEGWDTQLKTQIKSKHHPNVNPTTAAHELYGFKVALNRLGLLPDCETYVDPDHFAPAVGQGPLPRNPEEMLAYICDNICKQRIPGRTDEQLDAICEECAVDRLYYNYKLYIVTEDNMLYFMGANSGEKNSAGGVTQQHPITQPILIPILPLPEENVKVVSANTEETVLSDKNLELTFNKSLLTATPKLYIGDTEIVVKTATQDNHLTIYRSSGFTADTEYTLVFAPGALVGVCGVTNVEEIRITFVYTPDGAAEETPEEAPEAPVVYEAIIDESIQRYWTVESLQAKLNEMSKEYHYMFVGNAILNRISTDTNVSHWLRPTAYTYNTYTEIGLAGNWWGTTNEQLIDKQILDYADMPTYGRLHYAPYLTEAPENTFPFVTDVKLFDKSGEEVTVAGNEEITFRVTFNRDMDTTIPLQVRFGSAYPYGDYEIEGAYVDARTWEGKYTLKTFIENGEQYFSISNGCSATDDLDLQPDVARFRFEIDTTAAQALIMQGTATDTGIELRWTQDDFDTLMGYNVYRSTKADGLYTKLNKIVIPADTMTFFDDTVEPGVIYYYNFTVVKTDLTESEPSGKIEIMSKDTMAPNIYHSPVASAFTGANLVITATITDNLNIDHANLYYRVKGTEEWITIRMNKLNDKYSAIVPAAYVTVEGLEYYIEAFDGISYTYKGSSEEPYTVEITEAVDANSLGDVDGDGTVTNYDALLVLYAINGKVNLTEEQFARGDLNGNGVLEPIEALQILRYVAGLEGSLKM